MLSCRVREDSQANRRAVSVLQSDCPYVGCGESSSDHSTLHAQVKPLTCSSTASSVATRRKRLKLDASVPIPPFFFLGGEAQPDGEPDDVPDLVLRV